MTKRNYFNLCFLSHFPVARFAALAIVCLLGASVAHADTVFTAALNANQAVPATNSTATGTGSVILSDFQYTVTVTLNLSNLQSESFTARIHGPAQRGANGETLFTLPAGVSTLNLSITPAMAADLKAGLWYFSVVTPNFPNGEIRGQLEPLCAPPPANMKNWYRGENNSQDLITGINGSLPNGVNYTTGKVGKAFGFNGVNQYANLGKSFNYQAFTISMWVKPDATQASVATIVDNNSNEFDNWLIEKTFNVPNQYSYFDRNVWVPFTLIPNVWQHLILVRAESSVRIYRDGVLQNSGDAPNPIYYDGEQTLLLGRSFNRFNQQGYDQYWKGEIDEFSVFDRPLDEWEVINLYNSGVAGVCTESGATKREINGKIAFNRLNGGSLEKIFTINADGSNLVELTNNAGFRDLHPAFSPDGSKIVFSRNAQIHTMSSDGSNATDLIPNSGGTTWEVFPQYAPNGNIISFVRGFANEAEIYTVFSDGTNLKRLTNNSALDDEAEWSPNGQKIAFSSNRTGYNAIYTMNWDGSNQTQITFDNQDFSPSWSPDGSKIVFNRNGRIHIMNADGSGIVNPANLPGQSPSYSPDGTKIIFHRAKESTIDLAVVNTDGTGEMTLVNNGQNSVPTWQPIPNPENLTPLPTTNIKVSFYNVIAPGRTVAIPLPSNQMPKLPAGFVQYSPIYDIRTSASYAGTVKVSFDVPSIAHASSCSELRVMHFIYGGWNEGYYPLPVFNNGICTVSQNVYTLSPFMVARVNSNPVTLSGTITYGITAAGQTAQLVSNVSLTATGGSSANTTTNSNGSYTLENLLRYEQYTVTPSKSGNANGITPFDATLILRCVAAGNGCALSANQKLAADTNNSDSITPFDATQILRYVAVNRQTTASGQVGNWKFSQAPRNYPSLFNSLANQNYEAILVGEVSGNWTPPANLASAENDGNIAITALDESNAASIIESADSKFDKLSSEINAATIETRAFSPSGGSNGDENTIPVPIMLANDTGKSISSYNFAVLFDSGAMQVDFSKPFETNGTLSDGGNFTIISDTNTPGRIGVAAVSRNGIAEKSGTLLNLRFKIIGAAGNTITTAHSLAFLRDVRIEDNDGATIIAAGKNNLLALSQAFSPKIWKRKSDKLKR
ncbi:MAG TPA: LamG-like jellyroll fold domain-containing protein [Pyrinomonadaceae bacterium]|jgi:TolB protein